MSRVGQQRQCSRWKQAKRPADRLGDTRWRSQGRAKINARRNDDDPSFRDLEIAPYACRVHLISHAEITKRATAAVTLIGRSTQRTGALKAFNAAYAERRRQGQPVPSYERALAIFRARVLACVAKGETLPDIATPL